MKFASIADKQYFQSGVYHYVRQVGEMPDGRQMASLEIYLAYPNKSKTNAHLIMAMPGELFQELENMDKAELMFDTVMAHPDIELIAVGKYDYREHYAIPEVFAKLDLDEVKVWCSTPGWGVVVDHITRNLKDSVHPGRIFIGTKVEFAELHTNESKYAGDKFGNVPQHEVIGMQRNGPKHFILRLRSWDTSFNQFDSVSLDHVTAIASQPEMKRRVKPNILKDERPSLRQIGSSRTHYDLEQHLWERYAQSLQPYSVFDFSQMRYDMQLAGVFIATGPRSRWYRVFHGKKTKVQSWIKRNLNRYLLNPKVEQDKDDKASNDMMEACYGDEHDFY